MIDMPWFRIFPARWLQDVRWMSATTAHVYSVLTMMMLDREAPLADEPKRLARYCNVALTTFNKALDELLEDGIIWRTDEGLMSDFVNEEMAYRDDKRAKSKKALDARYRKKPEKTKADGYSRNTGGLPKEAEAEAEADPSGESPSGLSPSGESSSLDLTDSRHQGSALESAPLMPGRTIHHHEGPMTIRAVKDGYLEVDFNGQGYEIEIKKDGTFGDLISNEIPF